MAENTIVLSATDAFVGPLLNLIKSEIRAAGQQGRYADYIVAYGVTRENVKAHAEALAALITKPGPQVDADKKRTRYGNALNTAKAGLTRNLPKDDNTPDTDWLRLVKQAAENAMTKGEIRAEEIIRAVNETLGIDNLK